MSSTKTFPLILVNDFHIKIKTVAHKTNKSMNKFIMEAIEEKIQREQ